MSTVNAEATTEPGTGTARVKRGMAEMLKGGVIMDVVTPDQAKVAEEAGTRSSAITATAPRAAWPG